jgi:hypothetical protein
LLLAACVWLTPGVAAADCRPASPSEQDAIRRAPARRSLPEQGWVRPGRGVAIGYCDDHNACIAVGTVICATDVFGHPSRADASFARAGSERLLVLRWTVEHGGTLVYNSGGIEVWTTEAQPRRLLSVLEDLEVTDVGLGDTDPRDVCSAGRRVEIGARRIRVGVRSAEGECDHWVTYDRVGGHPLGAEGGTWSWTALAAPPAGGAPTGPPSTEPRRP